ncbi:SOS response-associated peptidase [Formosa sp. PL04]|uniref:SOS response-associated peptidase n=1 Tax=Formosa sp. PL04 TaxID=3081755 RepID=UPI002980D970|nr:SOS response-associated peptidase [Formosa sp. PL04]MDW5288879.1 SOS response-associated peptidase [Formosa sp. PL04]
MCFHTATTHKTKKLEKHHGIKLSSEEVRSIFDKPQYHLNGFAHPNMLVIPQQKPEVIAPGVWGIVPSNKPPNQIKPYYKEAVKYGSGLNARAEKLFDHFIYRNAIYEQRCIIPVTGFFEPHEYEKKKYPFFIQNSNQEPLSLAGIYTIIDTYVTFSIITKEASPLFAKIHNLKKRQPLILDTEQSKEWLSPNLTDTNIKNLVQVNYPKEQLQAYTVCKDLFSPKVDSNVCTILDKVDYNIMLNF